MGSAAAGSARRASQSSCTLPHPAGVAVVREGALTIGRYRACDKNRRRRRLSGRKIAPAPILRPNDSTQHHEEPCVITISSWKTGLVGLWAVFNILAGCDRNKFEIETLNYDDISNITEHGTSITSMTDLLGKGSGVICLLRPYAAKIESREFADLNDQISNVLPLSEGQFLIVWFEEDGHRMNTFNRRGALDATPSMSEVELNNYRYNGVECARTSRAYLYVTPTLESKHSINISLVERRYISHDSVYYWWI